MTCKESIGIPKKYPVGKGLGRTKIPTSFLGGWLNQPVCQKFALKSNCIFDVPPQTNLPKLRAKTKPMPKKQFTMQKPCKAIPETQGMVYYLPNLPNDSSRDLSIL